MNIKTPLRLFASVASLCLLPVVDAVARQVPLPPLPEPSVLSLGAAAAVAGIIAYRLRKKK